MLLKMAGTLVYLLALTYTITTFPPVLPFIFGIESADTLPKVGGYAGGYVVMIFIPASCSTC